MRFIIIGFLFFNIAVVFSQETKLPAPMIAVDSLYREDQFYLAITYNTIFKTPKGVSQNKFSTGLKAGFLRDMPINDQRNVAIASGLGLSYTNSFQNLLLSIFF